MPLQFVIEIPNSPYYYTITGNFVSLDLDEELLFEELFDFEDFPDEELEVDFFLRSVEEPLFFAPDSDLL